MSVPIIGSRLGGHLDTPSWALLIATHGSKREGATSVLNDLVDALRTRNPMSRVEVGFLTGHGPRLQDAASMLVEANPDTESIVVVPYFLGRSRFVAEVIPSQVQEIRQSYPALHIKLAAPLDLDQSLARVVADLVVECGHRPECGIVLTAHGGAHSRTGELLGHFSALVRETVAASDVRFGLLEGGGPTIGDAIAACIENGAEKIAVVPFFLLEGKHAREDVPREVEEARELHRGTDMEITRLIGASPTIGEIIEQRAVDAIRRPETLNGGN